MTASMASSLASPAQNHVPVSFVGKGRDFFRMLLKGSLYLIPTFGFYRFWLITKLRRHLWANTQVGGEGFEYTGTAKELLIGFFIAMAILVPLYIVYFILTVMLEELAALASLPLILLLYALMHFGAYRARRYRATRTVFRGVRFWMKGSGWAYAFRAMGWDLAVILTAGLALPWATASLERYRMRHTYFGDVQGDFTGTGWTLFKRGWWVWLLGVGSAVAFIWLISALDTGNLQSTDPREAQTLIALLSIGYVLLFVGLWPLMLAIFTRWQMEGLRFGEVMVSCNLRIAPCYGLVFKWFGATIAILLAFALVLGVGFAVGASSFQAAMVNLQMGQITTGAIMLFVLIAVAYLVLLLGIGIVQQYFFGRGLWVLVVNAMTVTNLHAVDAAVAKGRLAGVTGEGLADALDFNVGV